MRAVVLAAGEGNRLRPLTADRPKCLVELAGRPLLAWQLDALARAGIDDVTIVTGYRADAITAGSRRVHNPRYADTNMVASLMCARDAFDGGDDVLVAYGDIVYEPRLVTALRATRSGIGVVVDRAWQRLWELRMEDPLADAETLRLDADGYLVELGRTPETIADIEGQYVGLVLVRAAAAAEWCDRYDALAPDGDYEGRDRDHMFMTAYLQLLIDAGVRIDAVGVDAGWLEVDTLDDLRAYDALRARGELGVIVDLEEVA
jgi:L-glutamine-phosphate cytidylyltransferase